MYSAIFTLSIPHIQVTWLLLMIFVVDQIALGAYEVGSNMFILHLWGTEATPFMQCLQSMFGFGALIAPVIVMPFLVETEELEGSSNMTSDSMPQVFHPHDIHLVWPYTIVSLFLIFNSVYMFVMWRLSPDTKEHPSRKEMIVNDCPRTMTMDHEANGEEEEDEHEKDDEDPLMPSLDLGSSSSKDDHETSNHESKEHKFWKLVTIVLTLFFMHIYLGLEITFGSYLTAFAVKSRLHLSKAYGAILTTVYWTSFTLFRLLTILYVDYTGLELNIMGSIVVVLLSNAFLLPHGDRDLSMLWTGVVLIGVGTSSIFGCMFGFLEEHFPVTSMISALMIMAAVLGEFVFPFIISSLIDQYPRVFLWVTLSCSVGIFVLFSLISYICRFKLGKATRKD